MKVVSSAGLEMRGCREPRAPLNSPAAPSNFCREPKDVLVSIHNTFQRRLKMQLGSLEKLNFEPCSEIQNTRKYIHFIKVSFLGKYLTESFVYFNTLRVHTITFIL